MRGDFFMFCLLKISERRDSFKEKLFGRFIKNTYELKTIPVFKGAPFYKLEATIGKKGIDWQQVTYSVGKCANRLLLDDSISIENVKGVGRYNNKILYEKMMKNTFVKVLKEQNKTFDSLCVIDKRGVSTDFLLKLVPYFQRITITTDQKQKYEKVCDYILENTGLCVLLQSEIQKATVKIDTEQNIMTINTKKAVYNISDGEDFKVPEIYENLYDNSINKLLFYSALYEFCGVFELADLCFETILINGEKKRTNELIFT